MKTDYVGGSIWPVCRFICGILIETRIFGELIRLVVGATMLIVEVFLLKNASNKFGNHCYERRGKAHCQSGAETLCEKLQRGLFFRIEFRRN